MADSRSGRDSTIKIGHTFIPWVAWLNNFVRRQVWPFLAAMVTLAVIQITWAQYSSVIWFATGDVTHRAPGIVKMHVTAYKLRQCQYVADSELGYARANDGSWREVDFKFVNDITPNSTHPRLWVNRQSFGIWQWKEGENAGPIHSVMATVRHNCSGIASSDTLPDNLPEQLEGYRLTRIGPLDATGPIIN